MSPCLLQNTPYKGLFVLILIFVALEYIFNSSSDIRGAIFNTTKSRYQDPNNNYHVPLWKALLFKENGSNITTNLRSYNLNSSNSMDYVVTLPPYFVGNATSIYALNDDGSNKPPCPDISQYLYGRVPIKKHPVPSVQTLQKRFAWLRKGGHWSPLNCTVEKKVAIVIPFRCRAEHLLLFLQHMHPFLKKQQLDYTIFVLEQDNQDPFNRASLMNIGYVEALKLKKFDCFIFHDVDLLPEDDRNLYTCPEQPRHMSVAVDMFSYKLPYPAIFGGVSAISTDHFKLLNGFSNSFWGWGGEDDDMSNRIRHHHLYISRYPIAIARYTMLRHKKDSPNPRRFDVLKKGQKLFDKDGLSSLAYEVSMKKETLLYTWILVKLKPPRAR